MPIGYGCLGCALPMAIGAKLAAPDRPVAALAGDGGVMFTVQELATARDLGLPLPIVVYDNSGYGEIRDAMDESRDPATSAPTSRRTTCPRSPAGSASTACACGRRRSSSRRSSPRLGADGPTVIELRPEP